MRILVTGSREWDNHATIHAALLTARDYLPWDDDGPPILVHGAAKGADTIAADYWESLGYPTEPHPANWNRYPKKSAGHIRNAQMVQLGADLCLAFILNNSSGATGCAKLAKAAGIPTTIYRETRCRSTEPGPTTSKPASTTRKTAQTQPSTSPTGPAPNKPSTPPPAPYPPPSDSNG